MADVRIGISGPVFGTSTESYGIIENEEKTTEVQESEIIGGDGDIVGVDQYGKKVNVSFDFTYRASGGVTHTDVGSGSTIASPETATSIYVRSVSETFSKAPGYQTIRCEGSSWPDLLT